MSRHFEDIIRLNSQRLADLKKTTAELERELSDARISLERELSHPADARNSLAGTVPDARRYDPYQDYQQAADTGMFAGYTAPESAPDYGSFVPQDPAPDYGSFVPEDLVLSPEQRTEVLINRGRHSAYRRGLSGRTRISMTVAGLAAAITILVIIISAGGASWPASVGTVQAEIGKACQNPDVRSEPGQVDFACAQGTRQILWVFALLTSGNDPNFGDTKTGRMGLEPITPAQGGEVAASLNLHHPYSPANPIDSLQVAARAINDIIAGATVTSSTGSAVIQPGLEGEPANCLRYTGSAAVTSRQGYPDLCAQPVASPAGQAALVADVYRKWIVGAPPAAAQNAAVLFQNSNDPGNPQVQAILKSLASSKLPA